MFFDDVRLVIAALRGGSKKQGFKAVSRLLDQAADVMPDDEIKVFGALDELPETLVLEYSRKSNEDLALDLEAMLASWQAPVAEAEITPVDPKGNPILIPGVLCS